MDYTNKELKTDFSRLVRLAIEEDLGDAGDVTSSAVFTTEKAAVGLFSREDGFFRESNTPSSAFR
jgi:nicotinate-nucleotide pyrophosphorylase